MPDLFFPLAVLFLLAAGLFGFNYYLGRRRAAALELAGRGEIVGRRERDLLANVALIDRLADEERENLYRLLLMFQADKDWEACGGLPEVTQEMRDAISAQACLLILRNEMPLYPRLRSILIYPGAYTAQLRDEAASTRLGESWDRGTVVLSWQGVQQSGRNADGAFNLVIHEFAHQLDQADGPADGVPTLEHRSDYKEWSQVFTRAFDSFCEDVNQGRQVLLDDYGATNPAEFFAVASETYFERPDRLEEAYPQVFRVMDDFYGVPEKD